MRKAGKAAPAVLINGGQDDEALVGILGDVQDLPVEAALTGYRMADVLAAERLARNSMSGPPVVELPTGVPSSVTRSSSQESLG